MVEDVSIDFGGSSRRDSIFLYVHSRNESFEIIETMRHGKRGFRIMRRVRSPVAVKFEGAEQRIYEWDEWYQFYELLSDAMKAIEEGDYENGVKAFYKSTTAS